MNKILQSILLIFPVLVFGQGMAINDTPKEYIDHIVNVWEVDSNNIVYISDETSLLKLAGILHNSVLSFAEGELSTSAEILDGKREVDKDVCGLALNNLDLKNIQKHLKKGNDYTQIRLKKLTDNTAFNLSNNLTTVLLYSKKMDYYINDYFKIIKEFSQQGVDYIIITFDDEITSQIPGALNNG